MKRKPANQILIRGELKGKAVDQELEKTYCTHYGVRGCITRSTAQVSRLETCLRIHCGLSAQRRYGGKHDCVVIVQTRVVGGYGAMALDTALAVQLSKQSSTVPEPHRDTSCCCRLQDPRLNGHSTDTHPLPSSRF